VPIIVAYLLSVVGRQQPGLAENPKLGHAFAFTENAVPASTFVADVAKVTGTTLTCDSRIRDDLVLVVTRSRPVRETMQAVASHFDWRWVAVGPDAFKLEPSDEWARKARGGIPGEMAVDWQRARAKAQETASELSKIDLQKVEADAVRIGLAAGEEQGGFYQLIAKCNPVAPLVARTLAGLTDAQFASLRNRRIVMSTSPSPLELPMPAAVQSALPGAVAKLAALNKRMVATHLVQEGAFRAEDVTEVRFDIRRGSSAEYVFLGAGRQILYKASSMIPTPPRATLAPMASNIQDAIKAQKEVPEWDAEPSEPLKGFCQLAAGVAKKLDCDLVGDAYDSYVRFKQDPATWHATSQLTTTEGWLKLRSRRWIILRNQTVPRHVWASLGGAMPANLSLDEKAQFILKLESEQTRSPLVGWLPGDVAFYRFWAAASPTLRAALRAGKRIPLAQLPGEAHEYLYLQDASSSNNWLDEYFFEEPEFEENKPEEAVDNGVPIDTDYAGLYPRWLGPDSSLSLLTGSVPALYLPGIRWLLPPGILTVTPEELRELEEEPAMKGIKPRLVNATPMRFRFSIVPGTTVDRKEVQYRIGEETSFDPSTWPKELVARVKGAMERSRKRGMQDRRINTDPPR